MVSCALVFRKISDGALRIGPMLSRTNVLCNAKPSFVLDEVTIDLALFTGNLSQHIHLEAKIFS